MQKLEKLTDDLFNSEELLDMSKIIGGKEAPYNTYATSQTTKPSDTNDLGTGKGGDWTNL